MDTAWPGLTCYSTRICGFVVRRVPLEANIGVPRLLEGKHYVASRSRFLVACPVATGNVRPSSGAVADGRRTKTRGAGVSCPLALASEGQAETKVEIIYCFLGYFHHVIAIFWSALPLPASMPSLSQTPRLSVRGMLVFPA